MNPFPSKRIAVWSCKRARKVWWPGTGRMWAFCDKQGSASQHGQLYGNGGDVFNFHLHWGERSHVITLLWLVGGGVGGAKEIFAVSKELGRCTNWIFKRETFFFYHHQSKHQLLKIHHLDKLPPSSNKLPWHKSWKTFWNFSFWYSPSVYQRLLPGTITVAGNRCFLTKQSVKERQGNVPLTHKRNHLSVYKTLPVCKWADHEW